NLPIREIDSLSKKTQSWKDTAVKPNENLLSGIRGEYLDVRAEFECGDAEQFGLRLRGEPILYNTKTKRLTTGVIGSAPIELGNGILKLHILLDRTSLEIFANEVRSRRMLRLRRPFSSSDRKSTSLKSTHT